MINWNKRTVYVAILVAVVLPSCKRGSGPSPQNTSSSGTEMDQAVAEIKRFGGKITFDENDPAKPLSVNFKMSMAFPLASPEEAEFTKSLSKLSTLEVLDLRETYASDQVLKSVGQLRRLRSLHVDGNRLTDEGLQSLKGLSSLQEVDLAGTFIADIAVSVSLTGIYSVLAPVVTAAGYAAGIWIAEGGGTRKTSFTRIFVWPLVGCAVGAAATLLFGPLIFTLGTASVVLRELAMKGGSVLP